MARAIGIGGVFFRCKDVKGLGAWYSEALGLSISDYGGSDFLFQGLPEAARCVWGPFPDTTDYFGPSEREFMVNFIVDDLEGALERVERAGGERVGEIEEYEYGRFGWFLDPEGTKIELWQPPETSG